MALPAGAVINIMSTATAGSLNGGGFNAARGGTNYSLQNAAQVNGTDGTSNASTNFNSAAVTFTSQMVGNYLHLTAGTNGTVGWYEIVTFVDANNVTLDRNCSTGAMTNGTFYVGGAISLGALDDSVFEMGVAGNIYYIKGGATYTLGGGVNIASAGGTQNPIVINSYTTTQGDACTGSARPTIAAGVGGFVFGTNWNVNNLIITGTPSSAVTTGTSSVFTGCKFVNISTSGGRSAVTVGANSRLINCEAVSNRGNAVSLGANSSGVFFSWLHDSDVGLVSTGTTAVCSVRFNVISSCVTAAVYSNSAHTGLFDISNNTLFGSTNTTGIGVNLITGNTNVQLTNNIITGFVTGVSHADVQSVGFDFYNNYHNNDTDVTNWTKGTGNSAVAPSFTSVGQVTGATATTSGSVLTQSGADFTASGVVAGRDYIYLVSGTGITAGIYGITAVGTTTLTLDIAPGTNATADKVFQITTGHNFAVGTAMKALGFPGAFPGGYTTGYMDQGAVQRQEPAGSSSGSAFAFIG